MNILLDDGLTAVLADFGLSRLKADVSSRQSVGSDGGNGAASPSPGSRYWMAPERLEGAAPKLASDVYSFGMTVYEVRSLFFPSKMTRK